MITRYMDCNESFQNLDVYREVRYKRHIIDNYGSNAKMLNKACIVIGSSSSAFVVLQMKIMELAMKDGCDNSHIVYYGGYNEMKDIIYRMIEGVDVEFKMDDDTICATVEQISTDMGIQLSIDNLSYLFLRADNLEILQKFMEYVLIKKPERKIYQYSTENSIWRNVSVLKERDPTTLILKEGILDDLIADLDDFLKAEEDYNKFGIPYKKVYLFHGEPGTGKTSLSQVIACHTDRSLYILNFDPKMTDDDLSNAIRHIDAKNGILLLEDIDCLFKTRNTNQNLTSVSFSSLLNNLDGAIQNIGLITIITTNHAELLDPALRRPLRVDKTIRFERADTQQIEKLFELYGIPIKKQKFERVCAMANNAKMCPAGVSGFLFRNRKKELNDENILDLFKEYIDEMIIEVTNDAKETMFL